MLHIFPIAPLLPSPARLLAELQVLRTHSSGPAAAASLGYSATDLQAEVASLRRRRDARLAQVADAAEAAAAAAAGAGVVEEQAAAQRVALERRLQAKRQVGAGMGCGPALPVWPTGRVAAAAAVPTKLEGLPTCSLFHNTPCRRQPCWRGTWRGSC